MCLSVCAVMSYSSGVVLCAVVLTSCLLIQYGHCCPPQPPDFVLCEQKGRREFICGWMGNEFIQGLQ